MVVLSLTNTGIIVSVTSVLYGSVISDKCWNNCACVVVKSLTNTGIIVTVTYVLYGSVISDKYWDYCDCDLCTLW